MCCYRETIHFSVGTVICSASQLPVTASLPRQQRVPSRCIPYCVNVLELLPETFIKPLTPLDYKKKEKKRSVCRAAINFLNVTLTFPVTLA